MLVFRKILRTYQIDDPKHMQTWKIRVVFDVTAKFHNTSLNDKLLIITISELHTPTIDVTKDYLDTKRGIPSLVCRFDIKFIRTKTHHAGILKLKTSWHHSHKKRIEIFMFC